MNGKIFFLPIIIWALASLAPIASGATNEVIRLFDGSILSGSALDLDPTRGITWSSPAARKPILFRQTNIASILFPKSISAADQEKDSVSTFQFTNGDKVNGGLHSIEQGKIIIDSEFGGKIEAPQEQLQGIFFSRGQRLLYEGPTSLEGWKTGDQMRAWEYKDGAFVSNGADILGRDFNLQGSCSVEFEMIWNGPFAFSVTLYAQELDRFDYSSSSYVIYIGSASIAAQRIQAGVGTMMLGRAAPSGLANKNRAKFEIRCNKSEGTITVLMDGKFVEKWADPQGFVGKGKGILFFSQVDGVAMRLQNIRVMEWDPRFEPDNSALENKEDVLMLANKDKVRGKLLGVENGKAAIEVKGNRLNVPLDRIVQMSLAKPKATTNDSDPWLVQGTFIGGEALSFKLTDWTGEKIEGVSPNFGPLQMERSKIKQLFFNLHRPQPAEAGMEMQELDFE
ncbi:MAG: hypothetical protein SFY81_17040 [Verrucomicrobiota bacterium]|nr:hypothetical protein [Verrucomicrobiota bacterium]